MLWKQCQGSHKTARESKTVRVYVDYFTFTVPKKTLQPSAHLTFDKFVTLLTNLSKVSQIRQTLTNLSNFSHMCETFHKIDKLLTNLPNF